MNTSSNQTPTATVEMVVELVREHCHLLDSERVPLENALHRVLHEDVCAPEDLPFFDRSAVDGYAVLFDDFSTSFKVVAQIRAGEWKPRILSPGEAVQIATGAAMPCEALQVIMKEDVEVSGDHITTRQRTTLRNIRFRGEDAAHGQVLAPAGTWLRPGVLGLLASLGQTQPVVARLPRVLHVATGNEIVSPDRSPARGQIRDSNSALVRAFLQQFCIAPEQQRLPEDEHAGRAYLTPEKLSTIDLLMISGGASVGEHDFTGNLLQSLGYELHTCKTNTRPGRPLIFASKGQALAFGLPGNPLAHFVCLNLYVRAALEKLSGLLPHRVFLPGIMAVNMYPDVSPRETLWPARAEWTARGVELFPLRWSSSGDLTCLASANALLRVPPNCDHIARHAPMDWASTQLTP
jgi:molybdopterin molybdotransferase